MIDVLTTVPKSRALYYIMLYFILYYILYHILYYITFYIRAYIILHHIILCYILTTRRVGSDGSMSASGSAGPGFDPRWSSKFSISGLGGVDIYTF